MAKEKSVNPAQAQRKKEKEKALKKGKIEKAARRTEKLARRNPERLQRQVDELRGLQESGRQLNPRDKKLLEELERDVAAVRKAREALGDKAPQFENRRGGGESGRGTSRGRGGERRDTNRRRRDDGNESDSSTTSSIFAIPMPRDTPPPIPPEYLLNRSSNNPNFTPLPSSGSRIPTSSGPHPLPPKPSLPEQPLPPPVKVVYESAPVIRDLRKEATRAFMPAAVQRKLAAQKGQTGRLLEPEEADKLEAEGYGGSSHGRGQRVPGGESAVNAAPGVHNALTAGGDAAIADLEQEAQRFQQEFRGVQMEEVDDEDG